MSGLNLDFKCTAICKADCHGWVNVPKKERCSGCEIYESGNFGKETLCCADYCPEYNPRCRYCVDGQCTSAMVKSQEMVKELKVMGVYDSLRGVNK